MNRKFRYLAQHDRAEIERLHSRGATVAVIADKIGAHTATIYRELSNGYERDADGEPVIDAYGRRVYRAEIAQRTFERNIKNRARTVENGRGRNDRNRLLYNQKGSEKMDKEQAAIERLKTASEMSLAVYGLPLVVTTSGGKDSSVCVALAERAGILFEVLHNHTTADAPETVYFIREEFRRLEAKGIRCVIEYPVYKGKRASMWSLIPQVKNPPNRFRRYCCSILKERGGAGRFIATGVRWAESVKRKSSRGIYETLTGTPSKKIILNNDNDDRRRLFTCTLKAKRVCNPIVDWTDADVWDYIRSEHLTLNPLCQCGFYRVGCVGCFSLEEKPDKGFRAIPPIPRDVYTDI